MKADVQRAPGWRGLCRGLGPVEEDAPAEEEGGGATRGAGRGPRVWRSYFHSCVSAADSLTN